MSYPGVYRALVEGWDDPFGRRRLQVRIPSVGNNAVWALACIPPGVTLGRDSEARPQNLPAIGSTVWVMFEGGDAEHPVWIGRLAG